MTGIVVVAFPEEDRTELLEWVRKEYYEAPVDSAEFRLLWELLNKLVRDRP